MPLTKDKDVQVVVLVLPASSKCVCMNSLSIGRELRIVAGVAHSCTPPQRTCDSDTGSTKCGRRGCRICRRLSNVCNQVRRKRWPHRCRCCLSHSSSLMYSKLNSTGYCCFPCDLPDNCFLNHAVRSMHTCGSRQCHARPSIGSWTPLVLDMHGTCLTWMRLQTWRC